MRIEIPGDGCGNILQCALRQTMQATVMALSRRIGGPLRMRTDGICDDVDPCVGELDVCGVCNGPGEITSADALTSLKAIATATATSSMPLPLVVVVRPMPMRTASATTWTSVGELDARGVCNGPGEITMWLLRHSRRDCDCNGNQEDDWRMRWHLRIGQQRQRHCDRRADSLGCDFLNDSLLNTLDDFAAGLD